MTRRLLRCAARGGVGKTSVAALMVKLLAGRNDLKILAIYCHDQQHEKVYISNCPFCEVLKGMRLPLLARSVCEADWILAQKNADKWAFERTCQIGTGDTYCNSTNKRK